MTKNLTAEARSYDADLKAVINLILRGLMTWSLPADWGVDYGYVGDGREERRGYSSAEEVLAAIGINSEEYGDEWPPEELATYAKRLWTDAATHLRKMGREPTKGTGKRDPRWRQDTPDAQIAACLGNAMGHLHNGMDGTTDPIRAMERAMESLEEVRRIALALKGHVSWPGEPPPPDLLEVALALATEVGHLDVPGAKWDVVPGNVLNMVDDIKRAGDGKPMYGDWKRKP